MDCLDGYGSNVNGIIDLIKDKHNIAIKLIAGSKGEGFYKISFKENKYYLNNNNEITEDKIIEFLLSLNNYVITEYLVAHSEIQKIYAFAPNTVRIMVINDNGGPRITGAFMRFGTNKTGIIDNASAGGIFCGVNIETGELFKPKRYSEGSILETAIHPDSKVKIEGKLPFWNIIKQKLIEIGNDIPQLTYMGFDIIITDSGFKIIEINSLTGLSVLPIYFPHFKNEYSRKFFKRKFKEDPKKFKRVLKMLDN